MHKDNTSHSEMSDKKMKEMVLVLDDETYIRQDLFKNLSRKGYEVCVARSVNEAIEMITTKDVDFAIIDLKLDYSEYAGVNVIENINKIKPKTRVIVLSAYERDNEIEEKLNKVHFDGYISKGNEENYIISVINELARLRSLKPKKKCFVIMPFSATKSCQEDEWTDIFENTIKPAVEDSGFNYECFRACLAMGNIIIDIIDNLNKSDVVIADMTDRNPNVFYELGVRHSLRDATVLITQKMDDVPFDLRPYATLAYDWKTKKGKDNFKENIKKVFLQIEEGLDDSKIMSPVHEYFRVKSV